MVDSTKVNANPDSQPPQLNWNTLFRGDLRWGAYNACVGNNGSPDLYFYADGFAESVFLLIDILTSGKSPDLDTLIYPICFNLRHSVELTIKGQIQDLSKLAKLRKYQLAPDDDIKSVLNQHDIMILWTFFKCHAVAFDRRYNETVSVLDPLIRCIGETDPTGQTFRYSYSKEAKKHLTDVSVINIVVLREQFRIIREQLTELSGWTHWLSMECSTGVCTKNLSYNDLHAIALRLPSRDLWPNPDAGLITIKNIIKTEYNIGSKELGEAFKKIQNCRDLARIIHIPVTIPGLVMTDLLFLNDCWKLAWDRDALEDELRSAISGVSGSSIKPTILQEVFVLEMKMMKDTESSIACFKQWVTAERLAGLLALIDARGFLFSEEHDKCYEDNKKWMTSIFSGSVEDLNAELSRMWESIFRRNYPSRVIACLKHIGFVDESARLEENLFS